MLYNELLRDISDATMARILHYAENASEDLKSGNLSKVQINLLRIKERVIEYQQVVANQEY